MATRRKAPRQLAPQTLEEAIALIERYAGLLTEAERLRADADAAIAQIEGARDAAIAPMEQEAKDLFLRLRAWWAVAGDALTGGTRRSLELAGCLLGVRTTPPSLSTGKMKVDEAVQTILAEGQRDPEGGWEKLIRTKLELDRQLILRRLAADETRPRLEELGFKARQREEFFIDRAAPKPADPEEVKVPETAE